MVWDAGCALFYWTPEVVGGRFIYLVLREKAVSITSMPESTDPYPLVVVWLNWG